MMNKKSSIILVAIIGFISGLLGTFVGGKLQDLEVKKVYARQESEETEGSKSKVQGNHIILDPGTGNVGIATNTPGAQLHVVENTNTGPGILGVITTASTYGGIQGSNFTATGGAGIIGFSRYMGVHGRVIGIEGVGNPIYGSLFHTTHSNPGTGFGGCFLVDGSGIGRKIGVYADARGPTGSSNATEGVYSFSSHSGPGATFGGSFLAVGSGTGQKTGVYAEARGPSGSNNPVYGVYSFAEHLGTGSGFGGYFSAVGGGTGIKYGIFATASGGGVLWAGYFEGNVNVTGSLSKGSGSFLIDHPLDPLNKTLRHNFVESPENLCLYRGKVKLDANGEAIVKMPNYFAALTKEEEATVNLTPIGEVPFLVSYKWKPSYTEFTIYGKPNEEVAYVVYADRDDPVIRKLAKPVEEYKGPGNVCERGKLLYPEAYGYPETMGRNYKIQKERIKHILPKEINVDIKTNFVE